jgi:hypothetical protein
LSASKADRLPANSSLELEILLTIFATRLSLCLPPGNK